MPYYRGVMNANTHLVNVGHDLQVNQHLNFGFSELFRHFVCLGNSWVDAGRRSDNRRQAYSVMVAIGSIPFVLFRVFR